MVASNICGWSIQVGENDGLIGQKLDCPWKESKILGAGSNRPEQGWQGRVGTVIRMAMSKSLVIVESPAKAKTIEKYLGKGFEVLASVGHIMDLPKKELGVELENRTFEPTLEVSHDKLKIVAQLKKAGLGADEIFLAPDPDREGEAIAYHLAIQLGTNAKERKKIRRVTFNEITKKAVQE